MLENVFVFLKGLLFGASNLIPGMSGGTMLVITNIYDKLLNSIASIFKKFKAVILFLILFAIGAVIGVLGGGIFLKKVCLTYAPFPTYCFFAGIILGSIPFLAKPVIKKTNWKYILAFLGGLALVIGLMFLGIALNDGTIQSVSDASLSFVDYLLLFIAGFIGCFAMLIPGVSGVLMLVVLNYYGLFMDALANITHFSMDNYWNVFLVMVPVAIGIVAGLWPSSKLLSWMFKKFPFGSYFAILGFVIGSIPVIFVNFAQEYASIDGTLSTLQIVLGCVALPVGFILSFFLSKFKKKKEKDSIMEGPIESIDTNLDSNPKVDDAQEDITYEDTLRGLDEDDPAKKYD